MEPSNWKTVEHLHLYPIISKFLELRTLMYIKLKNYFNIIFSHFTNLTE